MQPFLATGARVALGAALAVGSLLMMQSVTWSRDTGDLGTAYAVEGTPRPTSTVADALSTPSAVSTQPAGQTRRRPTSTVADALSNPSAVVSVPTPPSINDQIRVVAEQVAQVAQDPTMSVDAKTTQINALAAQFNQLVSQWQQQQQQQNFSPVGTDPQAAICPLACSQPTSSPGGQPAPVASPTARVGTIRSIAPPVATGDGVATPSTVTSPDQIRSQIADVVQQMNLVAQDTSLSIDSKTAQLGSLSDQFNQLMAQLQEQGG